jgi:uncharacterized protein (TIGR03083 family)
MTPAAPGPILAAHLFPEIEAHLLGLLRALRPDEWRLPTLAPGWSVKDVTAHLLDTQLRRLALCRDGHVPPGAPPRSSAEVAALVNRLNAEGVAYFARLSPDVLIVLMENASGKTAAYLQSLDPFAPAAFGVSWAGEDTSANWFDVARELTERWHHQQQIRTATGRPGVTEERWMRPVLALSMRALPRAYAAAHRADGAAIVFRIDGEGGGAWSLRRADGAWTLHEDEADAPACVVRMDADTAWRVLLHALPPDRARGRLAVDGDPVLAEPFLHARAVMV